MNWSDGIASVRGVGAVLLCCTRSTGRAVESGVRRRESWPSRLQATSSNLGERTISWRNDMSIVSPLKLLHCVHNNNKCTSTNVTVTQSLRTLCSKVVTDFPVKLHRRLSPAIWTKDIVNGIVFVSAKALVELRNRSDTGHVNRSPRTTILPMLR